MRNSVNIVEENWKKVHSMVLEVFFVPKGKKIPATYMKRSFDKQGAIRVPPFYFPLFAPKKNPLAYVCRNCKTIMIFYEANEEE